VPPPPPGPSRPAVPSSVLPPPFVPDIAAVLGITAASNGPEASPGPGAPADTGTSAVDADADGVDADVDVEVGR
jgi:hypothetical protein